MRRPERASDGRQPAGRARRPGRRPLRRKKKAGRTARPAQAQAEPAPGRVAVGRIRRPWGTDGSLSVTPFASDSERLTRGTRVFVGGRRTVITSAHASGSAVVIRVDAVRRMADAESLRDALVEVAAGDLPPLPPGAYYHYQLVGARVRSTDGTDIGTVASVLETGSNDVYIVEPPDGGKEILIPALTAVVKQIDAAAGLITVDLPEGLV